MQVLGDPWSQSLALTQQVDWIDANTDVNSSAQEDVGPPAPLMMQACHADVDASPIWLVIPN